ncbi:MAG: S-adenosylmethionine:tRNA ribosyltransferase-isomerase, partial [Thermoguttaceae bacterium]|nr:S-adenosylmethionine:tRNA ribosyltransferase-isomerase [Thermoguttaceae bacterium]
PLPPYIRSGRMSPSDKEYYQTVYARHPGAVAAPTAGLHFTTELLDSIRESGVAVLPVTLHVGAGTFKPISVDRIVDHQMHSEFATISAETVAALEERKARGGRIIAIGTTSVRTLESASNALPDGTIDSTGLNSERLRAFSGPTNLFIRPPYRFKTVDAILTNFHLPKSTLIILVRTFGGDELLKRAYEAAIAEDYRFFSYGDAMLIL